VEAGELRLLLDSLAAVMPSKAFAIIIAHLEVQR
jgi:hypothetical protein